VSPASSPVRPSLDPDRNVSEQSMIVGECQPDLLRASQEISFGANCPPSCPPTGVFLVL